MKPRRAYSRTSRCPRKGRPPEHEKALNGTTFKVTAFPTLGGPDPDLYGRAPPKPVDLTGHQW